MRKIFLFCFTCLASFSFSQNAELEVFSWSEIDEKVYPTFLKNSIHAEAGALYVGFAGAFSASLNYSRMIYQNHHFITYFRAGIGIYGAIFGETKINGPQTPLALDFVFGKGKNHFEVDVGGRYVRNLYKDVDEVSIKQNYILPLLNLGYRFQMPMPNKKVILKLSIGTDGYIGGVGFGF